VHDRATSMEYFQIKDGVISLKEEYLGVLQGKITLPSSYNGKAITYIGNNSFSESNEVITGKSFINTTNITHVFFLSDAQYTNVGDGAFAHSSVEKVYLPDSIRKIGNKAFWHCTKLTNVTLNDNITTIGSSAF
jgi:hypothetical protein